MILYCCVNARDISAMGRIFNSSDGDKIFPLRHLWLAKEADFALPASRGEPEVIFLLKKC